MHTSKISLESCIKLYYLLPSSFKSITKKKIQIGNNIKIKNNSKNSSKKNSSNSNTVKLLEIHWIVVFFMVVAWFFLTNFHSIDRSFFSLLIYLYFHWFVTLLYSKRYAINFWRIFHKWSSLSKYWTWRVTKYCAKPMIRKKFTDWATLYSPLKPSCRNIVMNAHVMFKLIWFDLWFLLQRTHTSKKQNTQSNYGTYRAIKTQRSVFFFNCSLLVKVPQNNTLTNLRGIDFGSYGFRILLSTAATRLWLTNTHERS